MRLIDADALIKWLKDTYCDTSKSLWNYNHHVMAMDMIEIIENYPIVEERKHGHWIEHEGLCGCWICSNCNQHIFNNYGASDLYKFCPGCGAEMDEEEKE